MATDMHERASAPQCRPLDSDTPAGWAHTAPVTDAAKGYYDHEYACTQTTGPNAGVVLHGPASPPGACSYAELLRRRHAADPTLLATLLGEPTVEGNSYPWAAADANYTEILALRIATNANASAPPVADWPSAPHGVHGAIQLVGGQRDSTAGAWMIADGQLYFVTVPALNPAAALDTDSFRAAARPGFVK